VSFDVPADAYDHFMGIHSRQLSPQLVELAGIARGDRVLDVGCGPGALTTELVDRLGAKSVAAVDPSEPFVAAAIQRHPEVDVRRAAADALPFPDGSFDASLAQLVVHFMPDPVSGLREMARVTRAEGVVAACVWDHAGERSPVAPFWQATRELEIGAEDEFGLPGARPGHLVELFEASGLRAVDGTLLGVSVEYARFEDWWEPFGFGIGPAGACFVGLDADAQARLRDRCEQLLTAGPFTLESFAWAARGVV
jgi:SAM-dependent methyltransferase